MLPLRREGGESENLPGNLRLFRKRAKGSRHGRHSRPRLRGDKLRRESRKGCRHWISAFAEMTKALVFSLVSIREVFLEGVCPTNSTTGGFRGSLHRFGAGRRKGAP